jgi:hypothetical protein
MVVLHANHTGLAADPNLQQEPYESSPATEPYALAFRPLDTRIIEIRASV